MNALIDQLAALRLHGMAACAQDLLAARTPPSLTTALKTLIEAETKERRVTALDCVIIDELGYIGLRPFLP